MWPAGHTGLYVGLFGGRGKLGAGEGFSMGAQWHSLRSLQVCKDEAWSSWEKHGVKLSDEEGRSARLGTYTFWWSLTRFRRTLICRRNAGGW